MTTELLQGLVWLLLAAAFAVAIVYSMRRRKLVFPAFRVWIWFLFMVMSVVNAFEGNAIGVFFVWTSSIILMFLVFDIDQCVHFLHACKRWSKNILTFGAHTNVPILFALIAYIKGKRVLLKKLINFYYLRGHEK